MDVFKGRSTQEEKFGNDGADALVVAGAASHAVPAYVVDGAQCRTHLALNVHSMMLAIVCARQTECPISCGGEADRGADLGEDAIDVCLTAIPNLRRVAQSVLWSPVPKFCIVVQILLMMS